MATTLIVLEYLEAQYKQGAVLNASQCLEQADKLNILRGADDDLLADIKHRIAKAKANYLVDGMTSAKAKALVEALDMQLEYDKLKAHISRVTQQIMILKARARAASDELKGY